MPKSSSKIVAALGHLFASGDPDAIALACARLRPFLRLHSGNLTATALDSGVPLRTLNRWVSAYPELFQEVDRARSAKRA